MHIVYRKSTFTFCKTPVRMSSILLKRKISQSITHGAHVSTFLCADRLSTAHQCSACLLMGYTFPVFRCTVVSLFT